MTDHADPGYPADNPADRTAPSAYRAALTRLTRLDDEAAADREQAHAWYEARVADTAKAVRAAEDQVRAADQARRAATRRHDDLDAAANQVWNDFSHTYGPRRAERFGRLLPAAVVPQQRDRTAEDFLDDARATAGSPAAAAARGGGIRTTFALIGALGGGIGAALNRALVTLGHHTHADWAAAVPTIALIVMLLCPVLALIAGRRLADRRGAALDITTVATGLAAGLLTAFVAIAVVTHGRGVGG